jgi:UDP-4-amino-4,6-dideoxy-L-N-acetyl-beta-L-altrosamine transaminase
MIPYSCQSVDSHDLQAILRVAGSTHLTQGVEVERFEESLSAYLGVNHVCVFNSGTSALFAVYQAFGLGENDLFLTTPITFAATSNMGVHLGAKPLFCDVGMDGNLDAKKLESRITEQCKVIVPVDFGGNPVEINTIREIASRHHLKIIEDASHALGSCYGGHKIGTSADATVFSFHAIKPITTMEGGAIVTNDSDVDQHVRMIRSHGMVKKDLWHSDMVSMGFNFRLSDVACALGTSQLKKLDSFLEKRNEIATIYERYFSGNPYFETIPIPAEHYSTRHLYPILLHPSLWKHKERIFRALVDLGIGVQVHYTPTYQFSFYQKKWGDMSVESAEFFYHSELSIPCHQNMSEEDIQYISEALFRVIEKCNRTL